VVKVIEEYLNSPTTTDPNVLLGALQQIKVLDPATSQAWRTLLGGWSEKFAKAKKSEDTGRISN